MRKIAAAILAVPVLVVLYLPILRRRGVAIRVGLAASAGLLILVAAVGALPRSASALPPVVAGSVAAERFGPNVESPQALNGAVTFDFATPMDQASVAAALSVDPETPITLAWLDAGQRLLVSPRDAWAPETYYTVTIAATARDAAGVALTDPIRTAFYTRGPTGARIVATEPLAGGRVTPDTAFIVAFDRPVDAAAARAAFRIDPTVPGELQADSDTGPTDQITFIPDEGLAAGTRYTVSVVGPLLDTDGALVADIPSLVVETAVAPAVVRFRPRSGTEDVLRGADISVRFTRPMNRAATQGAFVVSVAGAATGAALPGDYSWAENDTVVVFNPSDPLPWGTEVVMSVTAAAVGADGTPIEGPVTARFTTAARPEATPAPTPRPTPEPTPRPTPGSAEPTPHPTPKPSAPPSGGGGSTGGGSWASVERYYLGLLNCTRGGGIVTSSGACSSPGGSGLDPLVLDSDISDSVSRPYAKLLATSGVCSHFDDGNPGDRLRRAGYTSYHWGENLGCRSASSAMASVLGTHLYFQSERSWSPAGGHWVNMMNPDYDRVGIGVWVVSGRVRVVIDFYRP